MKKFTLPFGGSILTTLAMMLLLMVTACENDDENPVVVNPVLAFNTDAEIRVAAGEAITVRPIFRPLVIVPAGTSWSWRILSAPENSQPNLTDGDQTIASFQTDLPGKYQLELTGTLEQQVLIDTLVIKAFDETKVEGGYQTLFNVDGFISTLYVYQDKLFAVGSFYGIGDVMANSIAFYDGSEWKPLGVGMQAGSNIADIIEFQGDIYVVGYFTGPEGVSSPAITRWDGTDWKGVPGLNVIWIQDDWGPYLVNYGTSLKVYKDQLYIGGYFSGENLGQSPEYSVLKWDGNQLTGVFGPFNSSSGSEMHLELYNDQLVVFSQYYSNGIAFFDGSVWKELNIPLDPKRSPYAINLVSFQEKLLINTFTSWTNYYEDQIISDFFIWDDVKLQEVFSPDNFMNTEEVVGDILYTGGENGIITWDGQQWGVVRDGQKVSISAIQQFQDQLFVAGSFEGQETHQIAIWQPAD